MNMISLVVPVYNESENLNDLYAEVFLAMSIQSCAWELIFVDDGSSDHSLDIIRALADKDERVHYISFESNCGQSAAFAAGFRFAQGDVVVTLDADLQNDRSASRIAANWALSLRNCRSSPRPRVPWSAWKTWESSGMALWTATSGPNSTDNPQCCLISTGWAIRRRSRFPMPHARIWNV